MKAILEMVIAGLCVSGINTLAIWLLPKFSTPRLVPAVRGLIVLSMSILLALMYSAFPAGALTLLVEIALALLVSGPPESLQFVYVVSGFAILTFVIFLFVVRVFFGRLRTSESLIRDLLFYWGRATIAALCAVISAIVPALVFVGLPIANIVIWRALVAYSSNTSSGRGSSQSVKLA
jgi:hypothetical protein